MRTAKKKKQKKSAHHSFPVGVRVAIAVVCVCLFCVCASALYGATHRGKILSGVSVGTLSLGNLSIEEAKTRLAERISEYEAAPAVIQIGEGKLVPRLSDLGVMIDQQATLARAYEHGRLTHLTDWFAFPAVANATDDIVIAEFNRRLFDVYRDDIRSRFSSDPIEPIIRFRGEEAIQLEGHAGRTVRLPDFFDTLMNGLSRLSQITVTADVVPLLPNHEQENFVMIQEELNERVREPIVINTGSRRFTITTEDLRSWIYYDPNTTNTDGVQREAGYAIDRNASQEVFTEIEQSVYHPATPTTVYASEQRGEYAVKNFEGRTLDRDATEASILTVLNNTPPRVVDVVTKTLEPSKTFEVVPAPRPKGKVISVNLTKQIVFAHENGRLVFWTRVSTGKGGYKTPTGTWRVYGKTAKQLMDGPGYYLPNVKWVSAYNGDYTLHGTYWHTNFGHPMSHGCTNLSETDAKWIFDWVNIGTPVIVYEE